MKIFQYWKIWNCNSIQIKNFEFASSTVKTQNKQDINDKIKKILKILYKKYMIILYDNSSDCHKKYQIRITSSVFSTFVSFYSRRRRKKITKQIDIGVFF